MPNLLKIILLAIIQGLAELLPVSSSAHVVVAEKLLSLDPTTPHNVLLLVLLHTGTMGAVIVYFWKSWMAAFFSSRQAFVEFAIKVILATILTGGVGYLLMKGIEKAMSTGADEAHIEDLFGNLFLIAAALAAAGLLIIFSGLYEQKQIRTGTATPEKAPLTFMQALIMGAVQGLALPFRGFSRSGSTISAGLLSGGGRRTIEAFSFALAVVITPAVIVKELHRLIKETSAGSVQQELSNILLPGGLGLISAFIAGLVALRWLSAWLEKGKWHYFGIYCLVAAAAVYVLYLNGL